jgi:phosphogluconate dehydratase
MALHRLHDVVADVTQRIIDRSRGPRQAYLDVTRKNAGRKVERSLLSCTNLAHGFAAMPG